MRAPVRPPGPVARLAGALLVLPLLAAACTLESKEEMEPRGGDPLADVTGGVVPARDGGAEAGDEDLGSQEDRMAVVGVAEAVLRGINQADTVLLRQIMEPSARVVQLVEGPDGTAHQAASIAVDDFVPGVSDPSQGLQERMWAPRVRIRGAVATVWAPYDFYVAGDFSHCGIDTFQLVRRADGWRVAGIVYTRAQPPACELHPDGPPPSGD